MSVSPSPPPTGAAGASPALPRGAQLGIIFVGPRDAGKTSLYRVYNQQDFNGNEAKTVMVDQTIRRDMQIHGRTRDVCLRDVMGQDSYATVITKSHLRGMHVAIFVADVTKPLPAHATVRPDGRGPSQVAAAAPGVSTMELPLDPDPYGLLLWSKSLATHDPDMGRVVVFNKADLAPGVKVRQGLVENFPQAVAEQYYSDEQLRQYVSRMDEMLPKGSKAAAEPTRYFFVSAKTGQGTQQALEHVFTLAMRRVHDADTANPAAPHAIDAQKWTRKPPPKQNTCGCGST
jgi:GTPase SAR1 family protein